MYAPDITQKFLEAQMRATPSFKAEYHSVQDTDGMIAVLNDAWDPEQKVQTRKLSAEEQAWIQNERLLCTHDFSYYASHYAYIVHFEKYLTRFTPNIAQQTVLDVWADMERKRWAILMIQGKARQLGVSTLTEIAVAHRVQFYTDVDAVVASSTPTKTEKLAKMIRINWDRQPWWLMPTITKFANFIPAEFAELNSSLDCSQSGNQFSGLSRGSTPSVYHLSELCEFTNPEMDVDASLLNAIHETPWVLGILESTALGRDNWWHKKWRLSKEGWARGTAKLCPLFLPWFTGIDLYPDDGWLRKHPVPEGWAPDDSIEDHARRAATYVKGNPRLRKAIGEHWVMPIEQMWWYSITREEARKQGQLNQFLQEMPADDFEMFQSTNHSVFPVEIVTAYRDKTSAPSVGVYKLVGLGDEAETIPVEQRPMSVELDTSRPKIPIRCLWGPHDLRFELVPVSFEGYDTSVDGKVLIHELPIEGYEYGFGVDTGDGIGLDGSVIEGLRKGTLAENDRQVLELASPYINALSFWPWAYALGSLYATKVNGEKKQPRVVIDTLRTGEAVQHEMRKRGWWHFHQWQRYDKKRLQIGNNQLMGFRSNQWARSWMLDMVQTYINNGWIDLFSPMFVGEMESLERDELKQSARAAFGAHDDRIISLGQVLFSLYVNDVRGPRMSLAEQRQAAKTEEDPTYDAGWQGRDVTADGMSIDRLEQIQQWTAPRGRR